MFFINNINDVLLLVFNHFVLFMFFVGYAVFLWSSYVLSGMGVLYVHMLQLSYLIMHNI